MNDTAISWTNLTWNPWSGCTKVSAGCKYCYAHSIAEGKRGTRAFPNGFDITMRPHKLREPYRRKDPSVIFTNSMTDMFVESVDDTARDAVFDAIRSAPWHRYQVLTKRPRVAARYFADRRVPDCVWLGVTVENKKTIDRLDILRSIDSPVRFVSAEPLLDNLGDVDFGGIHWVIGGGESGLHLRTKQIAKRRSLAEHDGKRWVPRADRIVWAQQLRDATKAAGAAFFWKQWGGVRPKSAGRELDGRIWDEMPHHIPGAMPYR